VVVDGACGWPRFDYCVDVVLDGALDRERILALCMARHGRLGADSAARVLTRDALRVVRSQLEAAHSNDVWVSTDHDDFARRLRARRVRHGVFRFKLRTESSQGPVPLRFIVRCGGVCTVALNVPSRPPERDICVASNVITLDPGPVRYCEFCNSEHPLVIRPHCEKVHRGEGGMPDTGDR
jgi:hypothetical protein